jgi:hypothetical protein
MYEYGTGQPETDPAAPMAPPADAPPAAPPEGAEPDVDADMMQLAQSAPAPTKPFSVKALEGLLKQFNATLGKISVVEMPPIEIDFSGAEKNKYDQPLPPDLFLPLLAVSELVKMVGGGEFESKYSFDVFQVLTDTDIRKLTAILKMMAKDKKFIEGVKQLQEQPEMPGDEGPDDMAPPPDDMGEDDEVLAANME